MRKTNLGVSLACTGLLTGLALPAAAGSATTYHGDWTSVDDCDGLHDIESGNWNVTIGPDDKAEVSVAIFYEQGGLHAAWGGSYFLSGKFVPNELAEGDVFDVQSGNKRFVLDEDGTLTFTVAGIECTKEKTGKTYTKTATLWGELDH